MSAYTSSRAHRMLTSEGCQKGTVQLIIALYSIVEKTRSGRHPRSSEKSFSTSTDGFRRHGASREAALDSKMLLKAVLIVCVVHAERKAKYWQSAREFYFLASPRGRSDRCQHGKGKARTALASHVAVSAIGRRLTSLQRVNFLARAHMTHLAKSEATCTDH